MTRFIEFNNDPRGVDLVSDSLPFTLATMIKYYELSP